MKGENTYTARRQVVQSRKVLRRAEAGEEGRDGDESELHADGSEADEVREVQTFSG